ncbi:gamma-glutamyl-gamma-aminobutyrate hydrolase family protein [Peribacillus alkalitolerans]|uniref:gamma-glutamyl-gamma-aminobutyrate hydrolase family protein n=1 Tax=Peribacillus alkalitolerans TaxID=1550385 RepID=UPI0013D5D73F|nr:gamma-glutamyl-gamma-aminobutyrate hydrolase family protein [Peribacillus alkalitolerans]
MKPLIGVTSNYIYSYMPKLNKGSKNEQAQFEALQSTYVGSCLFGLNDVPFNMSLSTDIQAIEQAGGIPIIIPQTEDEDSMRSILSRLDGIVFTGGNDIHPEFYGEEVNYNKGLFGTLDNLNAEDASVFAKTVIERDRMEIALMKLALEKTSLPILGICRGLQIMNVSLGGSLYQDLEKCYDKGDLLEHVSLEKWATHVHDINIENGSLVYKIFDENRINVNSIHHQAIRHLGDGLKATAKAADGIVEAIEYDDASRFVLGVQWHPEMLLKSDETHRKVFDAFIEASKKKAFTINGI